MNRKPLESNLSDITKDMAEDNEKVAAIIDALIKTKGENITRALLVILDDMNIRGVQILSLYKLCSQNIQTFYEKIINITKKDIEKINNTTFLINKNKAIYEGTSKDRLSNPDKYLLTDEEINSIRNKKSKDMVKDILENKPKKEADLYPNITTIEALTILYKYGFKCGYQKEYETIDNKKVIYRIFYNEHNDILYTNSLEKPDIFLWGESSLNIMRKFNHKEYKNINCNMYFNIKNLISYNIDLKQTPFKEYQKILDRKEERLKDIKKEYYDDTLIPIIESVNMIKYKEKHHNYKGVATARIYNLLTFPEIYHDLDYNLKQIYKPLLNYCEEKAYDEIIYELNADEGITIAKNIQDTLGINLDKQKLIEAKQRYQKKLHQKFDDPKAKILKYFIESPENQIIKEKIDIISA